MQQYLEVVDQINQTFEKFKMLVLQETKEVEQLESYSLTPQQEIIMSYIIRQERITPNEIASSLHISKSAVSQVLPKLEEKELIYRQANPANRREVHIYLGSKGQEYVQLLQRIDETLVKNYYSKVSLDELKSVLQILNKIVEKK